MLPSQEDPANDKQLNEPAQIVLSPKSAHVLYMQSHEQAGTVKAGGCQASEINTDSIALKVLRSCLCPPPFPARTRPMCTSYDIIRCIRIRESAQHRMIAACAA